MVLEKEIVCPFKSISTLFVSILIAANHPHLGISLREKQGSKTISSITIYLHGVFILYVPSEKSVLYNSIIIYLLYNIINKEWLKFN